MDIRVVQKVINKYGRDVYGIVGQLNYNAQGEPLEDKLYLPCGIDPAKKELGVAFVHPYPQNNTVLEKKNIQNLSFSDANWLLEKGVTLASSFKATPIYVFEATGQLWIPLRRYIHKQGYL